MNRNQTGVARVVTEGIGGAGIGEERNGLTCTAQPPHSKGG